MRVCVSAEGHTLLGGGLLSPSRARLVARRVAEVITGTPNTETNGRSVCDGVCDGKASATMPLLDINVEPSLESRALAKCRAEPRAEWLAQLKRDESDKQYRKGLDWIQSAALSINRVREEQVARTEAASRRSQAVLESVYLQGRSSARSAGPLWDLLPAGLRVRVLLAEDVLSDVAARRVLIACKKLCTLAPALCAARQVQLLYRFTLGDCGGAPEPPAQGAAAAGAAEQRGRAGAESEVATGALPRAGTPALGALRHVAWANAAPGRLRGGGGGGMGRLPELHRLGREQLRMRGARGARPLERLLGADVTHSLGLDWAARDAAGAEQRARGSVRVR